MTLPRLRAVPGAIVALALALAVGGCTTTPNPAKTAGPTAERSGTDRSSLVLGYAPQPKSIGSMTGPWPANATLTFHIAEVKAGPSSTLVTFWVSGDDKALQWLGPRQWSDFPHLVDPVGKKRYPVTTFQRPGGDTRRGVFTEYWRAYRTGLSQLTALYPPLPPEVTRVEIRHPDFPTVAVPVTRSP